MKSTERFSNRVDDYVRYRPHYPEVIISFLKKQIGLNTAWKIADIGSGTGISSEIFLQNGNIVYGVEPNREMRQAAEEIFRSEKNFISIAGTAEATSLEDKSIDLVVAGQAFHWFDQSKSKKEFRRIAAKDASLLLMWNERSLNSEFQQKYEQMLINLVPTYEDVCQRNIDEKAIAEFFAPKGYQMHSLPNVQYFDLESLKGRLQSCSYAPLPYHNNYQQLANRLEQLFKEFNVKGKVTFEYNCKLYFGNL